MRESAIILIGAGGHCRSCIDVIELGGKFTIAGIVERSGGYARGSILGYPVIGTDDDLARLRDDCKLALVTVGQIKSPDTRMRLFDKLLEFDFELPTIVSPLAYVSSHARIDQGTIVMHHALVNAGASIGRNCIINTKALIEHDAIIEDHCHVSTGAVVNGGALIEAGTFIGSNAMCIEGITMGARCVVGAGTRVLGTVPPRTWHTR